MNRKVLFKEAMSSTDCAALNVDIPELDEQNCCDHAAITCLEREGEQRIIFIDDNTGQLTGFLSFINHMLLPC
jgi:hypothetical protein